ncbi:MAG TPA: hypothetical protein VGM80_05190 [Gaiellaceae bacterium]|jgi:hypothetical protein
MTVGRIKALVAVVVGSALVAPAALAGSGPSVSVYGGVQGGTQAKLAASPGGDAGTQLPFTGLNLAIAALAVVVLVGCGWALRRAGRPARQ